MRRLLALLFILVLAPAFTQALDCQYTKNESYSEFGDWIFLKNGSYYGPGLNITDFSSPYSSFMTGDVPPSFRIHNQYGFPIHINITFRVHHPNINSVYQEAYRDMEADFTIKPYLYETVKGATLNIGTNEIIPESINYKIIEPKLIEHRKDYAEKIRTACDGKDDGESCTLSSECGGHFCVENICNNQTVCYPSEKPNCNCSETEVQCEDNKRCVPNVLLAGEIAQCNVQLCSVDTIKCDDNKTCVQKYVSLGEKTECSKQVCEANAIRCSDGLCISKIVKAGDTISCEGQICNEDSTQCADGYCVKKKSLEPGLTPRCSVQECTTNYLNKKGLCDKTFWGKVQTALPWILATILIISLAIYFGRSSKIDQYASKLKKKLKEEKRELYRIKEEQEEQHKAAMKSLEEKTSQERKKLMGEIETESKRKTEEIEEKIKELEKKEKEYKKIEEERGSEISKREDIQELRKQNQALIDKYTREKEKTKKELQESQEYRDKLEKERLTPFTNKQGNIVVVNEKGYEVFANNHNNVFHRWWFEQKHNRKIKPNYEVHHKDFNKRNNDINNLEEITQEEHDKKHKERYARF